MTQHEANVLSAFTGTLVGTKFTPFFEYVKFILDNPNMDVKLLGEFKTIIAIKKAAVSDYQKLCIDGEPIGEIDLPGRMVING